MNLSRAFIDRVGNTFGEDGRKLLADLPACWHIEDRTGGEAYDVACAEIYNRVRI